MEGGEDPQQKKPRERFYMKTITRADMINFLVQEGVKLLRKPL